MRLWRWFRSESGYGREKYHFDGQSLPSLVRGVIASPVVENDLGKAQKPVVKWAKHDGAKLRAKECVAKYLRLVARRRA